MTESGNAAARGGSVAAGLALALLSAGTFGASGIFASALISAGWSPAGAAIARLGGAAVLLAVPAAMQLRGRWTVLRRHASRVMIYGLLAIAGNQLFFFNAIESIPIGLAVVLEYLGAVLVVGWLWLVRGQRPGWLTAAGVVMAIGGLALLADLAGSGQVRPAGLMWGLMEAISLAAFFLLAAATGDLALPPVAMAWAGLSVAAAFLALAGSTGIVRVAVGTGDVVLLHHRISWIVPVLELSLVSAVIAYVAGIAAARRLGARQASFTGMAEVVFATLYAWLLLGQMPAAIEFAGGAVMLAGVILVRVDETRRSALRADSRVTVPGGQSRAR